MKNLSAKPALAWLGFALAARTSIFLCTTFGNYCCLRSMIIVLNLPVVLGKIEHVFT